MISDPTLFVDCDGCKDRIDFNFSLVLNNKEDWQSDVRFSGWYIDWSGDYGDAVCPKCRETDYGK